MQTKEDSPRRNDKAAWIRLSQNPYANLYFTDDEDPRPTPERTATPSNEPKPAIP